MKKFLSIIAALLISVSGAWAYSTTSVTSAQDSKGNALEGGAYYRILLPNRGASVALQQNGEYVKANNGLGIVGFMWKVEADANGKALISNPAGGYWKFTDYSEGISKLKTNGTKNDCTAFQMAWYSSTSKTLNLFDPNGGDYSYGGVTCGAVLSNHSGVNYNMGIYNNIFDNGSIFKFERFYQTLFVVETTDVNGVAVESYPSTVTINGNITTSEYYTNSDNQITSFSTAYAAAYYIDGVEKTAEEVKNAINANTGTLTVTVKPRPFIASTNEAPAYYALMISGNANSWWKNNDGAVVNCAASRPIPDVTERSEWIWELKQNNTDGYRIYNISAEKYLGGRTATGGAFTLVDASSANSFKCYYNNATTIKFKDYTNNLWIDRATVNNIGQPYAYTSGQQITFLRMYKVTFSDPITVNGVDNIETIYVKGDGTDVLTLPNDKQYSINGADAVGYADAQTAIAACSSNLTVTVSETTSKNVKYILKWSDGSTIKTIENVSTNLLSPSSDFLPNGFANDFVTLSYSPAKITSETSEVVVTATWNGPFQLSDNFASAKWYTVGIHSAYEDANHIWKYDSGNSDIIATEAVATNAYASLSDKNYFCFVGNPYEGLSIYNKAAGSGMTLYKSTTNGEHAKMASTGSLFIPGASSESGKTIANGYACFILKDGTVRLNCYDTDSYNVNGWTNSGNGSTCWFKTPSSYPLNFLNAYVLTAPAGAVGTVNVAADVLSAGNDLKNYFADNPFYFATASMVEMNMVLQTLNKLAAASEITLGEGYYRFVNAYTAWNSTRPTTYYNSTANRIEWSVASNTSDNVNSIFKVNVATPSVFSPNAQKFMSVVNSTVSGSLADEAGATEFVSLGSAQYNVKIGGGTMHTAGHNSGAGTSGNLTSWGGGYTNTADAWYIVKVDELTINLNQIGNDYYATSCLPFDYTLTGATAYTLALNEAKTTLQMEPISGVVPAGTPVVIKGGAATATATIASSASTSAPLATTSLTGIYVPTSVSADNNYFLGRNEGEPGFYKWGGSELDLAANRAYLTISTGSSSNGFKLVFEDDDDVTGIESALNGQSGAAGVSVNGQYYDLTGRKVAAPQKGQIYIVNGKKVLF